MADKIGDFLVRLDFYSEADALDFEKTGRAVLVVEDGLANMPLPKGDKGKKGDRGEPGSSLRPDLILDEPTDSLALEKLQERSVTWRTGDIDRDGYFALNKPTKSGFFYTRGGWAVIRDVFGGQSEIVAGEFTMPTTFTNVPTEPPAPINGVTLFAQAGSLKLKKSNGTVVTIG